MAGMVYLVGAGPGDYRLISLKAVDCLKKAEVVVYDRLADDRILGWAPRDAEFIYVGKASSHHTMKQPDINQLLVDKAKEGKTVVRLKGGDPFVFGRGGEEGLLLEENGLPFEVVPGITSAISVPAYAGIPVTHRGLATSFAVVTGHEDPTKGKSNIRWDKLATGVDTLVFLMGVANLPHITAELIANGRPADTPAAVIEQGEVEPNKIGKTVLVTRARSQASKLTAYLEELGARVIEKPAIAIAAPDDGYAAVDAAIAKLDSYQWLIFTSTNGVERFMQRLFAAGKDVRALGYAKVAAIGQTTAKKLQSYGICADVVPQEFRAEGILESLKGKLPPHAKILLPRAAVAREILPEKLREQGAEVDVVPVYQTVMAETSEEERAALREELENGAIDFVTFTSSSTVVNLVKLLGGIEPLKGIKTACIGPVTAETARKHGIEPAIVASRYTIEGLVEAMRESLV